MSRSRSLSLSLSHTLSHTHIHTLSPLSLSLGGSTAALAASIAAANHSAAPRVCLLEPTDWPGGQLTASGVTAIDFGPDLATDPRFLTANFRALMEALGANPGRCPVGCTGSCLHLAPPNTSAEEDAAVRYSQCYLPLDALRTWIWPTLQQLPNLRVFYNTVLQNVTRAGARVAALAAVQRTPRANATQWQQTLSQELDDWYTLTPSASYEKQAVLLQLGARGVAIEASEWGELLVLSGAAWQQGANSPEETSPATLDTCGTAFTYPCRFCRKPRITVILTTPAQS